MGRRSNLFLVDETLKITDCLHKAGLDVSTRPMLPQMKYAPPAPSNDAYLQKLHALQQLAQKQTPKPCILVDKDGLYLDFCFFAPATKFCTLKTTEYSPIYLESCNLAVQNFFDTKQKADALHNAKNSLLTKVGQSVTKAKKGVQTLLTQIEQAQDAPKNQLYGELLTAYMYQIKYGDTTAQCLNYYDNTMVTIPLDAKKSPSQNAQSYFTRYQKKQRTIQISTQKLQEAQTHLEYLRSIECLVQNADSMDTLQTLLEECVVAKIAPPPNKKHTAQTSEPRKFLVDGYTVLIGKNNLQNDVLVRKSHSTDLWLHASQIHGCHGIIKPNDRTKPIPLPTIQKVGSLVAFYSKAKSNDKIPVDYCPIKNVTKPRNSPPGKVVYQNQKTIWVDAVCTVQETL